MIKVFHRKEGEWSSPQEATVELSRVPCVGEVVEVGDLAVEVALVVHHTSPDEGVEATVAGKEVDLEKRMGKVFPEPGKPGSFRWRL